MRHAKGKQWEGLVSKEELDRLYPSGGFCVVGEVSENASKHDGDAPMQMPGPDRARRGVHAPGSFGGRWRAMGYVMTDARQDEWVAVMRRRVPVAPALAALALVLALAVAAWLALGPAPSAGPDLDPGASRYEGGPARPEGSGAESILMPGYTDWEMRPGADGPKVPLVNAEGNPCYMRFTVKLKADGEVLYQSKLVQPGDAVTDWRFTRSLEEGEYDIVIEIETFSLEDYTQPLNGAAIGTRLIVR